MNAGLKDTEFRKKSLEIRLLILDALYNVKKILRSDLVKLSINGGYKQIAGLGVNQMASAFLGLDILTSDMEDISKQLFSKFN